MKLALLAEQYLVGDGVGLGLLGLDGADELVVDLGKGGATGGAGGPARDGDAGQRGA